MGEPGGKSGSSPVHTRLDRMSVTLGKRTDLLPGDRRGGTASTYIHLFLVSLATYINYIYPGYSVFPFKHLFRRILVVFLHTYRKRDERKKILESS